DGVKYSAVAHDYLANFSALALVDDDTQLDPLSTRLQFSHTAPDVGQIDVYALTVLPGLLIEDLDFGASKTVDIPALPTLIGIDLDNDTVPDLTFGVPGLGSVFVDIYAVNETGGSPVFLLAHLPN